MRLLDDVRLIESEVLAPPTASTFERSIIKLARYEHSNSWTKLCKATPNGNIVSRPGFLHFTCGRAPITINHYYEYHYEHNEYN